MCCLGIESTAHTFGASVVRDRKVLSNEKDSYTTETGGMIPAKLSEHHVSVAYQVIENALSKAGVSMSDIDIIAFSRSPGIGHALRIGAVAARSLAALHHLPLVGVNHCIAHLEIGRLLTDAKDPVLLYASGANTQIIAYEAGKYRIFGETLDNGVGNVLDAFARQIGLGFPGGPKIAHLAEKGEEYIELPYTVKGMDVSFSGLLTHVLQKYESGKYTIEDLCYSFQETIFAMLTEVTERALSHCGKSEVLLGGGVACNRRLQEMMRIMCDERGASAHILENQFNVDNAAMIAWTGIQMYVAGETVDIPSASIQPYLRTDQVDVTWR
ncbi:MAG: bifunctional N(6)-L-threonylcarbamoyladenine synthase/serine/threonine protein kinase [Nanoarchaeota archaeon]